MTTKMKMVVAAGLCLFLAASTAAAVRYGNPNAADAGENHQSVVLDTGADATNATINTYGWVAHRYGTLTKMRVLTNITATGTLTTSTIVVKRIRTGVADATMATLTTDVATVGAGGTAQLAEGTQFVGTLSTTAANLDFSPGDRFKVEKTTAAATDTIENATFVVLEYRDQRAN